ncbi:hypothetical protein FRUB_08495 [Fimbriiglobus ruber]|uniref:Uncharacterized protein n=1 Tax=Fimbriiglobus ruber TaxID=1908690 RepID=A0A225D353_9BACT|nr:hypothetical protein FRUB_08495 [Fimbriiglobus ruber]
MAKYTFGDGFAIARAFAPLEQLCRTAGLPQISSFGFNDDLKGKLLVWHTPEMGLKAVEGLPRRLGEYRDFIDNRDAVREDLLRRRHALRRAVDQRIRFCALLRHGKGTCA